MGELIEFDAGPDLRIALASSSMLAMPTFRALRTGGDELVGLITKPDAPRGRGQAISDNELASTLRSEVKIYKPRTDAEIIETLGELNADLVITISYGKLIKSPALELPKYGWLNLHFSLLPKYRGAAPVQWAIKNGEERTGVTVFRLDVGMDTGPIFIREEIELIGDETTGELLVKLSEIGAASICRAVAMIRSGIEPTAQFGEASLAPKITKSDAKIDWGSSAIEIDRLVRAMNPAPMAWSTFRGARVRIGAVEVLSGEAEPGRLVEMNRAVVGTASGAISILQIQPEGKRMMPADEWLRGARVTSNDRFE